MISISGGEIINYSPEMTYREGLIDDWAEIWGSEKDRADSCLMAAVRSFVVCYVLLLQVMMYAAGHCTSIRKGAYYQ